MDSAVKREKGGFTFLEDYNLWVLKKERFEGFHREYQARPGDVLFASVPKTGTTWMKALLHSIMACAMGSSNLLEEMNPHDISPCVEMRAAEEWRDKPSPRLVATHLPLHALPPELTDPSSDVKIVYLVRNPRDAFVSLWKFREKVAETTRIPVGKGFSKEELLRSYCDGEFNGGPFVENVVGYSRESRQNPDKVLFVTYEDLQSDCEGWVRKISDFLGYSSHLVHPKASEIAQRCSFASLAGVQINKSTDSKEGTAVPNNAYFRKGGIGNWKAHFTPAMEEMIRAEIEEKLVKEDLEFSY